MKILTLVLPLLFTSSVLAETINVYFLWGQSNATKQVADGAREIIIATDPTARVFSNAHGGSALHFWYRGGGSYINLENDFEFLDARLAEITAEGHTPNLAALLVCQGESDRLGNGDTYWAPTFNSIIALYEERYGIPDGTLPFCLMLTDADRGRTTEYAIATYAGLDNEIRPAQVSVAQSPRGHYADSYGYERYDLWHLLPAEYVRLGRAMASSLLGLTPRHVTITEFQPDDLDSFIIEFDASQLVGDTIEIEMSEGDTWNSVGIVTPSREIENTIVVSPPSGATKCFWRLSWIP